MFNTKSLKKVGFLLITTVILSCNSDDKCTCRGEFLGPEGVFYGDVVDCNSGEPVTSEQASQGNPVSYIGCED